jgi:DNA-directed RNA polymerase specialized sigma subunit
MNPTTILTYAENSAKWYLRTNSPNEAIQYLQGNSIEDVIQIAVEKILIAKVTPKTKAYISLVVLSTITDLSKSPFVPHEPYDPSTEDYLGYQEILDSEDVLCNLKGYLDSDDLTLFNTYYEENRGIQETAEVLGISDRTVKRRLSSLGDTLRGFLV